jgi:hypothetical protein
MKVPVDILRKIVGCTINGDGTDDSETIPTCSSCVLFIFGQKNLVNAKIALSLLDYNLRRIMSIPGVEEILRGLGKNRELVLV